MQHFHCPMLKCFHIKLSPKNTLLFKTVVHFMCPRQWWWELSVSGVWGQSGRLKPHSLCEAKRNHAVCIKYWIIHSLAFKSCLFQKCKSVPIEVNFAFIQMIPSLWIANVSGYWHIPGRLFYNPHPCKKRHYETWRHTASGPSHKFSWDRVCHSHELFA